VKIFLSYASEQRTIAEDIAVRLQRRHEVFFDRTSLRASDAFDEEIRRWVRNADLFIFLISPEALTPGCYTLTELGLAKQRWKDPAGHLLPVLVAGDPGQVCDPYLRMLHILIPRGNLAAEVEADVARLAREWRWRARATLAAGAACAAAIPLIVGVLLHTTEATTRGHSEIEVGSSRQQASSEVAKPSTGIVSALLKQFDSPNTEVRRAAVAALAARATEDPAAMRGTVRALRDPDVLVRRMALESVAAGKLSAPEVVEAVTEVLVDPDAENQRMAPLVLAGLGSAAVDAVPDLVSTLLSAIKNIPNFQGVSAYYDPDALARAVVQALAQIDKIGRSKLAPIARDNPPIALDWIEIDRRLPAELLAVNAAPGLVARFKSDLSDGAKGSLPLEHDLCLNCEGAKALRAAYAILLLAELTDQYWWYAPDAILRASDSPAVVAWSGFSQALWDSRACVADYAWYHLADIPGKVAQVFRPSELNDCPKTTNHRTPAVCRARDDGGLNHPERVATQLARLSSAAELQQLVDHPNDQVQRIAELALQAANDNRAWQLKMLREAL
jgi:hypothetical protein